MAEVNSELNELFAPPGKDLPEALVNELEAIMRLHSIDAQEMFYKWESYSIKMGAENSTLDLKTARDFKKDLQDSLEKDVRSKNHARQADKRVVGATPRAAANSDVFGMLDGLVAHTPRPAANNTNGTVKRKSNFETPGSEVNKTHAASSPGEFKTPNDANATLINFADRAKKAEIEHTINSHIELPSNEEAPLAPRFEIKARTDMAKFAYKTMAMKLSEASEVLDDRIDEFIDILTESGTVSRDSIGNPTNQSTSEIVTVGRIASDSSEGRLNQSSLVLETSRRTGRGLRVPLRTGNLPEYAFFPGKIVALRGTNASGDYFTVSDIIPLPVQVEAASRPDEVDALNSRLSGPMDDNAAPLTIISAAGPYTTDSDLDFSTLSTLLETAQAIHADAIILLGPFLDAEHPLIRTGSYPPPPSAPGSESPTLADLFRQHISTKIAAFTSANPACHVVLVPSLRDAVSRHAAWPQDRLPKKELGLPAKRVHAVTHPMTLSMNEFLVGMNSLDVFDMIRREECVGGRAKATNIMERAPRAVIEQRTFCPIVPPTARENMTAVGEVKENYTGDEVREQFRPVGAMLDTSYVKLGEFSGAKPDMLIQPSVLPPFARVVENVLVINPGSMAKRKAYGTYARITVMPRELTEEERENASTVPNKIFERARVDIVRI
ncbi:DNA polymerase alpha/primase associated subunit [Pseudovirgaria hyperparasitica]|uniref:DNA polymerase alpha subunit B n=1 Tax=Pseudovirgaria hyperparasitica TaxID=470096 RepID=A0A6A6WKF2_9PEZI|nr:DNA polymerase alpha/primase associated subunit [Pseudovirgaria hyperparasitica]KAF2762637.1 DNA polymerase alpha/primase associated subunit [Pseudovirgaria hyperparasitica]